MTNIGRELLNVPFGEMVTQIASSIAQSQAELDRESIEILKMMGDKENAPVTLPHMRYKDGKFEDVDITTSMIGAGFQPTFYQFADTVIEVKMAMSVAQGSEYERKTSGEVKSTSTSAVRSGRNYSYRSVVTSTPIDATYTSKYNFNQEGSSLLRTRLVPVPPNTIVQRQIDLRAQAMQLEFDLEAKKLESEIAQAAADMEAKEAKK
ncbi:hypothetical protein [Methanimicrococcus blatticola]|uniref:Uncharacterized protein n=1 Tax=Methanimicrococcus blatticola TaxID=91560 RepID=A0A484F827_9EURY|nr:hypothetical protein [Methanimicrococcus blatticola]MBZ3935215.1 hypothetical protein [Methanimicrococcus blatticola]MCC2508688.1 hypothetical protein [Methanimicrococcus blatticola]TDQ71275.1 hypothetical protein C7391_0382 [Methanimicrococcus blatticola]